MIRRKNSNNLILNLVKENVGNEMAQAFIKIFETDYNTLKAFWSICLIMSISACAYLITQTLLSYFSYETYTSSKTIFQNPTDFPMITICNNNQYTTKYFIILIGTFMSHI